MKTYPRGQWDEYPVVVLDLMIDDGVYKVSPSRTSNTHCNFWPYMGRDISYRRRVV